MIFPFDWMNVNNPFLNLFIFFTLFLPVGEHRSEQTDSNHPNNNNGPAVPVQNAPDSQNDASAEHGEQDADDEAAEETDDTRSGS